jgi:hypothetical protein
VISCGSYTGNGSANGPTVTLGYEPQWLLVKESSGTGNWFLTDTMRGFSQTSDQFLLPNSSGAEFTRTNYVKPLATGFQIVNVDFDVNEAGSTYIYIAIRRGPMKVPTTGTSVFTPVTYSGTGSAQNITTGIVTDAAMIGSRSVEDKFVFGSRLTANRYMLTNSTVSELTTPAAFATSNIWSYMNGFRVGDALQSNASGSNYVTYGLQRAPSFFDEVCYTGTGANRTVAHNLAAVPELMIVKSRNTNNWCVYASALGNTKSILLDSTDSAFTQALIWNNTTPTASVFTVGTNSIVNDSGTPYVAYLFATCPGVSKVGSYTGNGGSQTINCGFTGGARFILIKRTNLGDSSSNWYVWDSARGINAGNDPSLMLNSTAAEVVDWNSVGVDSTGFTVTQNAYSVINASGSTYIFLAIA